MLRIKLILAGMIIAYVIAKLQDVVMGIPFRLF